MDTARLLRFARETVLTAGDAFTDAELLHQYATERDEAAFAELVRRNGPFVLRTCRHLLGEAVAEDAFQATFLLLARSASRLTRPGSLAGWLHTTAVRIALKARRGERRRREREAASCTPHFAADDLTWREVREVIDVELVALPEKYRVPLVLCYLQELSYEEAARQVGCPVGTLRGRLERGRKRLRQRLTRYGLPLAPPILVFGSPPALSATLIDNTLATVRIMVSGREVPPAIATLAGVQNSFSAWVLPIVTATLLAFGAMFATTRSMNDPPIPDKPHTATRGAEEPASRTDRFGDPLPTGAVMRLGTTRLRHGGWVTSVAFSRDGKEIASAAIDHTVRIWDRQTQRELRRLKGPFTFPNTVVYAAGGTRIVTSEGWFPDPGWGQTPVRLWDAKTGELVRVLAENGPRFNESLRVSPDGKTIAFRTGDAVVLQPVAEGGRSAKLPVKNCFVSHLAFSPDGQRLLMCLGSKFGDHSGSDRYGVRMFDLTKLPEDSQKAALLWSREPEAAFESGGRRDPAGEFSPDGKQVFVSFYQKHPLILDAVTGQEIRQFADQGQVSYPFFFLHGGKQVVATSHFGSKSTVWDVHTGKLVAERAWGELDVRGTAVLSPDGKTIATAGHRTIRFWDAATLKESSPTSGSFGEIDQLVVSPDGKRVLAVSANDAASGARLWDLDSGQQIWGVPDSVLRATLSPNGKTVAIGNSIKLIDATTGTVIRRGKDSERVGSLIYGLGGKILVGGWDGMDNQRGLPVWDAETLKPLPPLMDQFPKRREGGYLLAVTPDGTRLAVPGYDGVVRVWDLTTGKVALQLDTGRRGGWRQVALSADGRFAITGLGSAQYSPDFDPKKSFTVTALKVWDLETGRVRLSFNGPNTGVISLVFSPDGRTVAIATHNRGVQVYELATGKRRAEFRGHEGAVTALAFTPDGKRLLSGGSDTTILVWDLIAPTQGPAPTPDTAWTELLDPTATKVDHAMRCLASTPNNTIELFQKHLKIEPQPDTKKVKELLTQLGSSVFVDREKAQAELERMGSAVLPALKSMIRTTDSAEAARRAGELVNKLDRLVLTGEALRQTRAVEVLERIGSSEAQKLLETLARGSAGARLTREASDALSRLKGGKETR